MCFSAEASFVSAAIIGSVGVATLARREVPRKHIWIATLPLIFALHQLIEGLVWLSFNATDKGLFATIVSYTYTFIAYTLWPIYIPLAVIFYNDKKPKIILIYILALGLAVGSYLFFSYALYHPVEVSLGCGFKGCSSLVYNVEDPIFGGAVKYPYAVAATLPFFFCTNAKIRYILGPAFLLSFPLGLFLSEEPTFPSIWCFIAAFLSTLIFFVLPDKKKKALHT